MLATAFDALALLLLMTLQFIQSLYMSDCIRVRGFYQVVFQKTLDDGWPESETGHCPALSSHEIVKIELSKSHDFFIQSVIE